MIEQFLNNLEPPVGSIRNFGDDSESDEEEENLISTNIEIKWNDEIINPSFQCDVLLIGVGEKPCCFLDYLIKTCLKSSNVQQVGRIHYTNTNNDITHDISISMLERNICFILIKDDDIDETLVFDFVESIFHFIKILSRVLVFSLIPSPCYSHPKSFSLSPPLIRCIGTDLARKMSSLQDICPFLEAPIMIDNFPAAIISHGQVFDKNIIVFFSLDNAMHSEGIILLAFEPIIINDPLLSQVFSSFLTSGSQEQKQKALKRFWRSSTDLNFNNSRSAAELFV